MRTSTYKVLNIDCNCKTFLIYKELYFLISANAPLCRYKGFYEYAKTKGLEVGPPVGLDVLIDGTVATSILSALLPY